MAESVKVYSKSISEITSSIKELQRQIQVLKDYMAGLSVGSEEFKKAGEQAKQLQDKITAINDSVKGVDRSLPSVKNLRDEMKALKDQMAGVEEGSDAFYEIANKAGTLKHQLDEINQTVRGASQDFGDMLGNGMTALNGIIGGFTALQGAMELVGVENEDIIKSIKKLQSLMAIGQGISQIDNGIKALSKLQKAITGTTTAAKAFRTILTPKWIAGITVAISALAVAWEKWGKNLKSTTDDLDNAKKTQQSFNDELERELRIRSGAGVTTKIEDLRYEIAQLQVRNEQIAKSNEELEKQIKTEQQAVSTGAQAASVYGGSMAYAVSINTSRVQDMRKAIEENNKSIADNNTKIEAATAKLEEEEEIQRRVVKAKSKDTAVTNKNEKALKLLSERLVKLDEQIKGLIKPYQKRPLQDIPTELEQINTKIKQTEYLYVSGQSTIDTYYDNLIGYEELKLSLLKEGTEEYYAQAIAIENLKKEYAELTQSNVEVKAGLLDYVNVGSVGLSSLGNILSGFADLQDTTTKEGIQKQADLQYAAAVMNTANAIIGAWTSSMSLPAPASFIVGGIQSAAAATMGGIQIAKITQAANKAGANLSGGSSATVSSSAVSSLSAPIQYTSDVNSSKVEDTIKNTKIYVSVTDINEVQDRVKTQVTENRY